MAFGKRKTKTSEAPKDGAATFRNTTNDKVVVAFIHPGEVSSYFLTSLVGMLLADQRHKARPNIVGLLQEWSSANVSAARNTLTRRFVDEYPQADWLLWIDADMNFDPDAMDRLLAVADPNERPIVGGLCFGMNQGKLFPTIYMLAEDDEGKTRTVRVGNYPPDTVTRVAGTGAAFLLIHRSALETIREHGFNKTFEWFQESEMHGQPVGEDITFSLRALTCGIPMHVDTGTKIGHHKSQLLDEQLFLFQVATSGEEQADGNDEARAG